LAKYYNSNVFWLLGVPVEETSRVVANATALGIYEGPPRPVPLADPTGKIKQTRQHSGWSK
jgi:hypothetical protein